MRAVAQGRGIRGTYSRKGTRKSQTGIGPPSWGYLSSRGPDLPLQHPYRDRTAGQLSHQPEAGPARRLGLPPQLSNGAQSGPLIGVQQGPLDYVGWGLVQVPNRRAPRARGVRFKCAGVAGRVGGTCLPTWASLGRGVGCAFIQTRFLNRQHSLPVFMIS